MTGARVLVFDVGGSHISGALAEGGDLHGKDRVTIDCHASSDAFLASVTKLADQVLQSTGLKNNDLNGMSFAFPGPFDYEAGISRMEHKFQRLNGLDLRLSLAKSWKLEAKSIQFVNDADAFLLGELSQLPHSPGRAIGITLGTGVGSAFAVDGRIVHEGSGVPNHGEIWNIPWHNGIVEDEISTRSIQAQFKNRSGEQITVKEIADRVETERAAQETFKAFGETLGSVLQAVAADFRPELVIFGGAISRSSNLFLPYVAGALEFACQLRVSALFESAALYGAAEHWRQVMSAAKS